MMDFAFVGRGFVGREEAKEIKQTEQSQSRNDPDTLEPDIYI